MPEEFYNKILENNAGNSAAFSGLNNSQAIYCELSMHPNLNNLPKSLISKYFNTPSIDSFVEAVELRHTDNARDEVYELIRLGLWFACHIYADYGGEN